MSAPKFPKAMPPVDLIKILQPLSLWASRPSAEADLECIFGPRLDWASAFKHLEAFRRSDFSLLPFIHTLSSADMPGLWGGYSRETSKIYLSSDCPEENLAAVLIEEIGHFLDQELCAEETPGEEGARFASCVLDAEPHTFFEEEPLATVYFEGATLSVEAAPKLRGSQKRLPSPAKKHGAKTHSQRRPHPSVSEFRAAIRNSPTTPTTRPKTTLASNSMQPVTAWSDRVAMTRLSSPAKT